MENVVNFEQTKDHAKEIIYFNDGRMAAKNESTIYVVIKNVFIICIMKNTEIKSVTCEIGEVSGVVPEYLTDCWGYARKKSGLLKDSELRTEIIPGVTVCEDCGKTYSTVQYAKICPYCGSSATYLLEGNGFSIKEIEGA